MASEIGEFEAWTRLTVVRTLWGQDAIGPSGVPDQFTPLITLAISPPPTSHRGQPAGCEWASARALCASA